MGRKCEHCGSSKLSYSPPIHGDYGFYLCLDCGKHSNTVRVLIAECFEELVDPKIKYVFIKDLYQSVKGIIENLTIKDFHKALLEMWEQRKVELAHGSTVRPHVSRYGLHVENRGVYAYVKVEQNES